MKSSSLIQTGDTPFGTQRDIVAARDQKRSSNKAKRDEAKKGKKPAPKPSKEPVVKRKEQEKTKRQREVKRSASSKKSKQTWESATDGDALELLNKKLVKHWGTWYVNTLSTTSYQTYYPTKH